MLLETALIRHTRCLLMPSLWSLHAEAHHDLSSVSVAAGASYLRRAKRLSKSVVRTCQRRRRLPIQPWLRYRSVHVRGLSLRLGHLRDSSGFVLSVEDDPDTRVGRQGGGICSPLGRGRSQRIWFSTDLSRYLLQGFLLANKTSSVRLVQPGGLRGSRACLAAGLPQG